MSVSELKAILNEVDDNYEVIINMRHNYPISKESGLHILAVLKLDGRTYE